MCVVAKIVAYGRWQCNDVRCPHLRILIQNKLFSGKQAGIVVDEMNLEGAKADLRSE